LCFSENEEEGPKKRLLIPTIPLPVSDRASAVEKAMNSVPVSLIFTKAFSTSFPEPYPDGSCHFEKC
jgi:hypothetical protein